MTEVKPIATVGDLIEKLGTFDLSSPVRAQHALSSTLDLVVSVGDSPDMPGAVAIIYMLTPEAT